MNRRQVLAGALVGGLFGAAATDSRIAADTEQKVLDALGSRALLGINNDLVELSSVERVVGYDFPVVGGLYLTFDSTWAHHEPRVALAAGRTLMVAWMPQAVGKRIRLTDITAGRHDAHIDRLLIGMRSFEGPVVCRFGFEFNGNWMPWSAAYDQSARDAGADDPVAFVRAWQYIVDRERAMGGVSNIRWFWCASGLDLPSDTGALYTLEDYFPGDSYVDLVGCDAYNEPTAWDSFDTIFGPPYQRITTLSAKPFWIGETGCHEPLPHQRGTKGEWISDMLDSRQFPNLRVVMYFNYNVPARADWRLDSSPNTLHQVVRSFASIPCNVGAAR